MSTEQQQMQGLDHFWQEPWTQDTWMSTLSQNPAAQGLQPAAWMYTSEFPDMQLHRQQKGVTLCPFPRARGVCAVAVIVGGPGPRLWHFACVQVVMPQNCKKCLLPRGRMTNNVPYRIPASRDGLARWSGCERYELSPPNRNTHDKFGEVFVKATRSMLAPGQRQEAVTPFARSQRWRPNVQLPTLQGESYVAGVFSLSRSQRVDGFLLNGSTRGSDDCLSFKFAAASPVSRISPAGFFRIPCHHSSARLLSKTSFFIFGEALLHAIHIFRERERVGHATAGNLPNAISTGTCRAFLNDQSAQGASINACS